VSRAPRRRALLVLLAGVALVFVPLGGAAVGDLDPAFGVDGKVITDFEAGDVGEDVAIQRDGKIVVVGWNYGSGVPAFLVARYNLDGSLDSRFGSRGRVRTDFGSAYAVAIQRDGKIVVSGERRDRGERNSDFALVRYNPNGTLDPSFDGDGKLTTDFGPDSFAAGLVIQPDGKIVAVGGARDEFAAARYLPNGALDPTFDGDGRVITPFTSATDAAADVALQADGKLVAGGYAGWRWWSYPLRPHLALARYNPDGSLDATFGAGGKVIPVPDRGGLSFGHDVAIQSDGKILLAGGPLLRFNADGSLDWNFGDGGTLAVTETRIEGLAVQRDRKIVAVGVSERYDFTVDRLRPDGRADAGFAMGGQVVTSFGPDSIDGALAVAIQRDGKLVVAGATTHTPQAPSNFALARYLGDPPPVAACLVPGVRGETLPVARSRIVRARCTVGRVTRRASQRVEQGRVISQTPRAGTRLRVRGKVDLVVSRGRR
jgi:uncharacterized delta-60 repeat protein